MIHERGQPVPPDVLRQLAESAGACDRSGHWPADQIQILIEMGAFKSPVGRRWDGNESSALDQHLLYEAIASASLAASLILSQRDAAVGLIEASESPVRDELLPRLARGEFLATVGIAQLTTSRQGGPPALRATPTGNGAYRLNGLIPWCTGAAHADYIAVGAGIDGGDNLLALLPAHAPGVRIDDPLPLVALSSTATTLLHCDAVEIGKELVLRVGQNVLARTNHLPLGQAYLALGLCRSAADLIHAFRSQSARRAGERFEAQLSQLRDEVVELSQPGREAEATAAAPSIRGRCNDLALRATHAAVTLYKGTGLLAGHPAQRLAREALFLLVWSCPASVIDCTVELLAEPPATCDP